MGEVSIIGLDLAKHVFQVHGVDEQGNVIVRKQLPRGAVVKFFAETLARERQALKFAWRPARRRALHDRLVRKRTLERARLAVAGNKWPPPAFGR
jgi:transposase